jgi:hypothetical protein
LGLVGCPVELELSPGGVADVAHQAAQGFFGALAGCELCSVVVAAGCVVADLGDRGDLERMVEVTVPGPVESVRWWSPDDAATGAVPV